ncbi:MAG: hypothetical protein IIA09_19190 [Proteobacteria bacterium]|nr:hypothetical protein [Pseudomonadota bacterium]
MKPMRLLLILIGGVLVACSPNDAGDSAVDSQLAEPSYVVMGEDLQQLKDDFNANEGRVRLLFISGPTCGICLRGMADLNDAFIAASQGDNRLVTFVVHVPALGAREEHVAATIPLLQGPRIHHYWEDSGIIGQHFSEVMGVEIYVWDFWMIYGPEARWDGLLPPAPDYYEHQLGVTSGGSRGFPRERVLDAERFAAEAAGYIARVDADQFVEPENVNLDGNEMFADGTVIPVVAQPRNVAVRQHIMGRGGYKNLKRIQSIRARGSIETDSGTYDLIIEAARPDSLRRMVTNGERGLPSDLERLLLDTFEFDGLFVEWPDKGHKVEMVGMLKIGDVLAWKLSLQQADGPSWYLYINSHGGALVRADILDDQGELLYEIRQSDFRETSDFMFPHRIEYLDSAGRTLAVETIDAIEVDVEPFDLRQESVAH